MKRFSSDLVGVRAKLNTVRRAFTSTNQRLFPSLGVCSIAVFAMLPNSPAQAAGLSAPPNPSPPVSLNAQTLGVHKPLVSAAANDAVSSDQSTPVVPTPSSPTFARGYILVQPRPGLSDLEFDKALSPHGGRAIGRVGNLNVYVVTLPSSASEQAVAQALAQHPHIKSAEVDRFVSPGFIPNDTYYGSEWHLQMVNAPGAWDYSTGSGITVAILDSGVDSAHPDLQGQLVPGWNFYDNNSNTADVYGHGTMVAGVVGAIANNATGVTGIAWNAKIMPIRITDTSGIATLSGFSNGLSYAADHGAKVANLSFAAQSSSTVQTAAQYFKNKGGVVVNSAGNYGTLDSTAPSDTLVSVSATDSSDALASWSSYGPYVDVSAPGVGIWTTTMGGGYGAVSGTSFSSPLTAGVVALIMAAKPGLTPSQVVSVLESTAVDKGTSGYDYYYGNGRVDAAAAVMAAAGVSTADTQPPTVAISSPSGGTISGIVPVNISASDNTGVTRVDLLVNGALLASDTTAPYGFSWDSTALAGSNATLAARAYDAAGNSASSQAVTVTVASPSPPPGSSDTTPPTANIASPTGGTVSGVVTVNVNASDNVGVTKVDLLVNGTLLASDTTSPYSFTWDSTGLAGSNATLVARAYDAAGNSANSQTVTVAVASTGGASQDTTPPIVAITAPSNGSTVSGNATIAASASDNVGVANLSVYVDGVMVSSSNHSSVSYRWNTRKAGSGSHTISAVARDAAGNQTTTTINVTK